MTLAALPRTELFTLDPLVTYLNHGAFGAVPAPVQEAQRRVRERAEANPTAFYTRELHDAVDAARERVAAFLRADPECVALMTNASAAATLVLRSLDLSPGDELLVTDHGYGTVALAAREVADRVGAQVREVAVPLLADDGEVVDRITAAVSARTRLVVVDHVTSPTARVLPVGWLVAALRERGVPVLVDAAHAPGMLDVDVAALGADYWFGNLHKWAFAPRPSAALVVAPERRAGLRPLVVSWGVDAGFPQALERAGTLDSSPWLAAPAALDLLERLGPDDVRAHNAALAREGQGLVTTALADLWPDASPRQDLLDAALDGRLGQAEASMRLVPLPPGAADDPADAAALRRRLADVHRIETQLMPWRGVGLLRLSAQLYNDVDDYATVASALREELTR